MDRNPTTSADIGVAMAMASRCREQCLVEGWEDSAQLLAKAIRTLRRARAVIPTAAPVTSDDDIEPVWTLPDREEEEEETPPTCPAKARRAAKRLNRFR